MGINVSTLYKYQVDHNEIREALKRGKGPADIEVENALYKRAVGGFKVKEERIEKWKGADGIEREHVVITTKEVPPDVTAQIYWLNNRKPQQWRNKREVTADVTNNALKNMQTIADLINHPQTDIDIQDITVEAQENGADE